MKGVWFGFGLVVVYCVAFVVAKDKSDHGLVQLNSHNWHEFVNEDNNVLVKFFAPWCGHCQQLAPHYEHLADHFRGNDNIIIAEADVSADQELAGMNDIRYVPLMRFYPRGSDGEDFNCGHHFESLRECVENRLG